MPDALRPFVNCILMQERTDPDGIFRLPLYADGYPGIMFQQSDTGFYRLPGHKKLSELFLYGQTLEPISLEVSGPHRFVVFQLYPFASKYLLGIDPKVLNDACYDLLLFNGVDVQAYYRQLTVAHSPVQQVHILCELIAQLILHSRQPQNDRIQQAIQQIIVSEGRIRIKDLSDGIFLSERTLERNFLAETGLSPKQFAKIIQFQTSLTKLTGTNDESLTAIGLDSGFNDQSHFIRVFKQYTGQTPSWYVKHSTGK